MLGRSPRPEGTAGSRGNASGVRFSKYVIRSTLSEVFWSIDPRNSRGDWTHWPISRSALVRKFREKLASQSVHDRMCGIDRKLAGIEALLFMRTLVLFLSFRSPQ